MRKKLITVFVDILVFLFGASLYSIGVMSFITPNEISPGGLTGISTLLSEFAFLSAGVWLLILNIPLIIIGFRKFGGVFIWKTGLVILLTSFLLDLYDSILPKYFGDKLLSAIFGGLFIGCGLAFIMLRGATTGGIDIAAKLINRRMPHISIGRLMLFIDVGIVALAAFFYKNAETAMYSFVALFASSMIMDNLLYGADKGKLIFIMTERDRLVSDEIFKSAGRGVTVADTFGGYTGRQRKMLLCAVRRQEVYLILSAVRKCDEKAFVIVTEAGQIVGEGFERKKV